MSFDYRKELNKYLKPIHLHEIGCKTRKIRLVCYENNTKYNYSDNIYFRSKKRRYEMMDTMFQAESQGLIYIVGIAEETNTFFFES